MNITPTLANGENGPIKRLTCRTCQQTFYLSWADYKRLGEDLSCHECSVIENERAQPWEYTSSDSPFPSLWTVAQVAAALHLGRTKVYELIWREGLPVIRFGGPYGLHPWRCKSGLSNEQTKSRIRIHASSFPIRVASSPSWRIWRNDGGKNVRK